MEKSRKRVTGDGREVLEVLINGLGWCQLLEEGDFGQRKVCDRWGRFWLVSAETPYYFFHERVGDEGQPAV